MFSCCCFDAQVKSDAIWPIKSYLIQLGMKHHHGSYIADEKEDDPDFFDDNLMDLCAAKGYNFKSI